MKDKEDEKGKAKKRVFQGIMIEIRDSILCEFVFNLLTLIPRMIVRLVKSLF